MPLPSQLPLGAMNRGGGGSNLQMSPLAISLSSATEDRATKFFNLIQTEYVTSSNIFGSTADRCKNNIYGPVRDSPIK
jgi:hypothetical protein